MWNSETSVFELLNGTDWKQNLVLIFTGSGLTIEQIADEYLKNSNEYIAKCIVDKLTAVYAEMEFEGSFEFEDFDIGINFLDFTLSVYIEETQVDDVPFPILLINFSENITDEISTVGAIDADIADPYSESEDYSKAMQARFGWQILTLHRSVLEAVESADERWVSLMRKSVVSTLKETILEWTFPNLKYENSLLWNISQYS